MPILLFALWLVFCERIAIDVIVVGLLGVAAITAFMAKYTGWSVKRDMQLAGKIIPFIGFVLKLIFEVVKANIHIISLVLSDNPDELIKPRIVAHKTRLKTSTGRVALANSITLTPGTVTVDVVDGTVYVHAIDDKAKQGLLDNALERKLENMERGI